MNKTKNPILFRLVPLLAAVAIWGLFLLLIEIQTGLLSGHLQETAIVIPSKTVSQIIPTEIVPSESAALVTLPTIDTEITDDNVNSIDKCIVPDLVGMEDLTAEKLISELGLHIIRSEDYIVGVNEGLIVSQNPLPDITLDPCVGSIEFMVSLGSPPTQPPPPSPESTYIVRIYDIDDEATLYIQDEIAFKARWAHYGINPNWVNHGHKPGDSGDIDITSMLDVGSNTLRFTLWNKKICCTASFSIEVREDGKVIFSDAFTNRDSSEGIKYDKTIAINVK